ncbi:MAG: hypothetical protein ABEK16_04220 [Candidatus Nanohalobium sp.]
MSVSSQGDEAYDLQDLADDYRGIKTLEHMVRRTIERKLPEESAPKKLNLASKISRSEINAYAKGYDEWEIELPVGNEEEVSASMPAIIAEEVGHNTEKDITDNQIDTEKDD